MIRIPDDFWIGTSSSAWQVEGNSGKKPYQKSWADLFYETDPDRWYDRTGPEKASDFYHRYEEDIETMASLGMRAFRITIQWARFMEDPITGTVSREAVEYYRAVIRKIRECSMEPVISLEHWDIPAILFEKYGGWVGRQTVALYENYVKEVLNALHDQVQYWFAFTEPSTPIDNGYLEARWYPFLHDPGKAYQAHFHKVLATACAVRAASAYTDEGLKMGVMIHLTPVYSRSSSDEDIYAAHVADLLNVRFYLDPYLKGEFPDELFQVLREHDCMFSFMEEDMALIRNWRIDMLGADYYFPIRVKSRECAFMRDAFHPEYYYEPWIMPGRRFNSDRGWEIYPEAILDFAKRLDEEYPKIPWLISENGIGIAGEERFRNEEGFIEDSYRVSFICEHLQFALKARERYGTCFGYLIWSYIDNVSPLNAFKNRYGLLELDLQTEQRIPKRSARWLKEVLAVKELQDIP